MHISVIVPVALVATSVSATSTLTIKGAIKPFNLSPTKTEYASTTTTTSLYHCGTHEAVMIIRPFIGHGPVRRMTKTVTAPLTTVTAHVCHHTAVPKSKKPAEEAMLVVKLRRPIHHNHKPKATMDAHAKSSTLRTQASTTTKTVLRTEIPMATPVATATSATSASTSTSSSTSTYTKARRPHHWFGMEIYRVPAFQKLKLRNDTENQVHGVADPDIM